MEVEAEAVVIKPTPEERIRAAKTPGEVAFVLFGLAGEGLGLPDIISAAVDAKIDDSELPKGTDRTSVKTGVVKVFAQVLALVK